MPSGPITVILNSNHNKRIALIRPASAPGDTISNTKEYILRESRNKFRIKALQTLHLKGGRVVQDDDSVDVIEDTVFVSKGEPYCGPLLAVPDSPPGEMRIIGQKSYIEATARKQLNQVTKLKGVRIAVGMPDLHPGSKFPIGCAIASDGIYPALIGSDAGCGIALYHLSAPSKSSINPKKLAGLLRGLEEPWTGSVASWLQQYGIERSSSFDASSLGTIGGGNHFAEICTLEKIVDPSVASDLRIVEGGLYLLVHTGSRGLGASILAEQTSENTNPYLEPGSPEFDSYLVEHDYAVKWAVANRDLVARRVGECLYGPEYPDDVAVNLRKMIDVTHNSVTQDSVTVGDETRQLWIHRKGAAPHDKGIVPCPGSRGDYTWLLQPLGDGQLNVHSLAHGAGRRFGRNVLHAGSKQPKSSLTTTKLGSEVVCTNQNLLLEERPEAYKDIAVVVEDMEESGVCKGVVQLCPVVTYKIREEGK